MSATCCGVNLADAGLGWCVLFCFSLSGGGGRVAGFAAREAPIRAFENHSSGAKAQFSATFMVRLKSHTLSKQRLNQSSA